MAGKSTKTNEPARNQGQKSSQKKTVRNGSKKAGNRKAQNSEMAEKFPKILGEILIWLIIALCIFHVISNFGLGGSFGNAYSGLFFGIFGFMGYLFPFFFGFALPLLIANFRKAKIWFILTGVLLIFFSLMSMTALIRSGSQPLDALSAFRDSKITHLGGGYLGGWMTSLTVPGLGTAGTILTDLILIVIGLILVTGKSLLQLFGKAGLSAGRGLKEKSAAAGQEISKRRAERRLAEEAEDEEDDEEYDEEDDGESGSDVYDIEGLVSYSEYPPRENRPESGLSAAGPSEETFLAKQPDAAPSPSGDLQASAPEKNTRRHGRRKISEEEISANVTEVESAMAESSPKENEGDQPPETAYYPPSPDCLNRTGKNEGSGSREDLRQLAAKLENTLNSFGVEARVTQYSCGPAVTRFEITPAAGVKVSKIVNLADDLKLNLAVSDIRIEAPIPGKAAVGVEVPNGRSVTVGFRELIESPAFVNQQSKIAFAVGKDIGGDIVVADIAKMPHVLIAGATGSGKSVCINTIIMSILYKAGPDEVKMIMIDPKVVELSVYNGIPHLLIPVVTDPKKASGALNWAVLEMTDRYQKFADLGVRDMKGYNQKVAEMTPAEGQTLPAKMPQIVIIVDELADLMMVASKDVEEAICRLAQLARAAGIHLVIATQRPSVNVITGLIKANMPSRIAFAVTSSVDSRTILDMGGAEKLLGKGDMLFSPQGIPKPVRLQGAFVSDEEVSRVVDDIRRRNKIVISAEEQEKIEKKLASFSPSADNTVQISQNEAADDGRDPLFVDAAKVVVDKDKASSGMLQRYLRIGFNRASRIMEQLEEAGIVGPEVGTKPRTVLMSGEQLENYLEENG